MFLNPRTMPSRRIRRLALAIAASALATVACVSPASAGGCIMDNCVPVNTGPPAVVGTPQPGAMLTTTTGSWTNSPTSYWYSWYDCDSFKCKRVATGSQTYVVQPNEYGDAVRSQVTALNSQGASDAIWSNPSAVIASPPFNTAVPTLSTDGTGVVIVGSFLQTSTGLWVGNPASYAYQWESCSASGICTPITGATSSRYTLQQADLGHTIRASVTASNSYGSTIVRSPASAAVQEGGVGVPCGAGRFAGRMVPLGGGCGSG